MKVRSILTLGGALAGGGLLLVLTACGSGGDASRAAAQAPEQTINYTIVGADDGQPGPDGNTHDTFSTNDPTNIKLGTKVTLTFANKDDAQHSFTIPELGINVLIPGAKDDSTPGSVTYSFVASKAGNYRWFCAIPCDGDNNGWAMQPAAGLNDQTGFMAGYLNVS